MKILVISDIHLTKVFEPEKFEYLKKLFSRFDKIILNGDFWTAYSNSFDEFVNSQWSELFPLMLEKDTFYIYGNHDHLEYMDDRLKLFSTNNGHFHKLSVNDKSFHFEHGHKFFKAYKDPDDLWLKFMQKSGLELYVQIPLEHFFWTSYFTFKFGFQDIFRRLLISYNTHVLNFGREKINPDEYLVIGHTHHPEIREAEKFINLGFVNYGIATYLEIDENGYTLIEDRY